MRRYDDPVEVRKGWVTGRLTRARVPSSSCGTGGCGRCARCWRTGSRPDPGGSRGAQYADGAEVGAPARSVGDLLVERELWRVEAGRGGPDAGGVFDLSFDWTDGRWQLVGCAD